MRESYSHEDFLHRRLNKAFTKRDKIKFLSIVEERLSKEVSFTLCIRISYRKTIFLT